MALHKLSAVQAARAIKAGEITSEALVAGCLARIEETGHKVQPWAHFDHRHASFSGVKITPHHLMMQSSNRAVWLKTPESKAFSQERAINLPQTGQC